MGSCTKGCSQNEIIWFEVLYLFLKKVNVERIFKILRTLLMHFFRLCTQAENYSPSPVNLGRVMVRHFASRLLCL
jgi:hypothetical protein